MISPSQFRLGWRAVLADSVSAALAMALAYLLRFGVGEAWHYAGVGQLTLVLVIAVQVVAAGAAGLYSLRGQVMWPIRLAAGVLVGMLAGMLVATWTGAGEGVSRQALIGTGGACSASIAVIWRALRRAEGAAAPGPGDLASSSAARRWWCRAPTWARWRAR
jgi:hypothetical protein